MKKLFAFILAIVYLASSAGATVHLHYCMDKLVKWSLSGKKGNTCDNCGMEKDGGCCKDENKFVKNNADQRAADSFIQAVQIEAAILPSAFIVGNETLPFSQLKENPLSLSPPALNGNNVYIINCVFRI